MKNKLLMSVMAIMVAFSLFGVSVTASEVYTENNNTASATVTVTKKTKTQHSGEITDTLGFEVVWEDTNVEIEKTERYKLVWNPESLKYEKEYYEDDGNSSYYLYDKIRCKITNRSLHEIVAIPEFTPAEDLKELIRVQEAHKQTSDNTWSWARECTLQGVTGVDMEDLDKAATVGETGNYQIQFELPNSVGSDDGSELWEKVSEGGTIGTVTIKISRAQ